MLHFPNRSQNSISTQPNKLRPKEGFKDTWTPAIDYSFVEQNRASVFSDRVLMDMRGNDEEPPIDLEGSGPWDSAFAE